MHVIFLKEGYHLVDNIRYLLDMRLPITVLGKNIYDAPHQLIVEGNYESAFIGIVHLSYHLTIIPNWFRHRYLQM